MSLPFYVHPGVAGTSVGATVTLDGDEARHAVVVKRTQVGERIALTDGAGTTVTGTVAEVTRSSLTVRVEETAYAEGEHPRVVVVQAIPKGDRGELAVEMLTEVGVNVIVPWAASRSVAVWKGERATKSLARWRSTAREAAKQARRAWFPEVTELASTADVAALVAGASLAVVLHEAADLPLAQVRVPEQGTLLLVVGPEGGLADEELAALGGAGAGVVHLGAEVLRTSTAGVGAVAALLSRTARWGDLRG